LTGVAWGDPLRRAPLALLFGLASALLGACGTGSYFASTDPARGGTIHIVMQSLYFNPVSVDAHVGQTVSWTNEEPAPHNVTYVSGPKFRSSPPELTRGDSFSIRLTRAGTIHYYCTIHPWMKATIHVS
jgi:plastocyanin